MALVLTRKPGEAVIFRRRKPDGETQAGRLYVIAVEGNTVRLAIEALPDVEIVREELVAAPQRWLQGGLGVLAGLCAWFPW